MDKAIIQVEDLVKVFGGKARSGRWMASALPRGA